MTEKDKLSQPKAAGVSSQSRAHDPPSPVFPERNVLPGRAALGGEIRGG